MGHVTRSPPLALLVAGLGGTGGEFAHSEVHLLRFVLKVTLNFQDFKHALVSPLPGIAPALWTPSPPRRRNGLGSHPLVHRIMMQ